MTAPSLEQLQQLKHLARADVLKKWASGKALSAPEMSEIADLLPLDLLANPPPPRPGYRHGYDHYAAQLGYDVRNIKRLVAVGKVARFLCPLDDLGQFPAWWEGLRLSGHLKMRCQQRVIDAALAAAPSQPPAGTTAGSGAAVPEEKTPAAEKSSTLPTNTNAKVDFSEIQGVGLEASVHELKIQLGASQKAMRQAMETGENDLVVSRKKKHFEDTVDLLGKTEKTLQTLREARGELVPLVEVRADLVTILSTLRGMKRRLADNICAALAATFTPEQLAAVRSALAAEAAREETLLRAAKHWKRGPDGSVLL